MTYEQLYKFIAEDMTMSHVYQPVMLIEMLMSEHGAASVQAIAKAILNYDPTQVEYYSEVVKKMPGIVLTKNRGIATKNGNTYLLKGFENLTPEERQRLVVACEKRIQEYEYKKGGAHWEHRRKTRAVISGSVAVLPPNTKYKLIDLVSFQSTLRTESYNTRPLRLPFWSISLI